MPRPVRSIAGSHDQQRNLVFVGTLPQVDQEADRLLSHGASSSQRSQSEHALQQQLASVVAHTTDAQELLLLSTKGAVAVSTVPGHAGKSQAKEQYFIQGLSHTAVENPYTSSLTGQPTITVSTPLFLQGGSGRQIGVLAANLNLERIDGIVLPHNGLGTTGAAYLVGRDHRFVNKILATGAYTGAIHSAGIDSAVGKRVGPGPLHQLPGRSGDRRLSLASRARRGHGGRGDPERGVRTGPQLALEIGAIGCRSWCCLMSIGIYFASRRIAQPDSGDHRDGDRGHGRRPDAGGAR